MGGRLLVLMVAVFLVGASIVQRARARARVSPEARSRLLWRAAIAVVIAIGIFAALPGFVRTHVNQESPGGIVVYLLGWMVSGLLALGGIATAMGAWKPGDARGAS